MDFFTNHPYITGALAVYALEHLVYYLDKIFRPKPKPRKVVYDMESIRQKCTRFRTIYEVLHECVSDSRIGKNPFRVENEIMNAVEQYASLSAAERLTTRVEFSVDNGVFLARLLSHDSTITEKIAAFHTVHPRYPDAVVEKFQNKQGKVGIVRQAYENIDEMCAINRRQDELAPMFLY